MCITIIIARGRNALASAAEIISFHVGLAGYFLLIPSFGAYGAAYGSLLGSTACLVSAGAVLVLTRHSQPHRQLRETVEAAP